jgi:uncharacterized protein YjiS (DUF1127 family)
MASTPITYEADLEAPAPRGFAASIARMLAAFARAVANEVRIRHDTRELRAMSDHMLKDIGLTRAEIGRAVRYGRD